ncbi:MAG: hypothetical protein HQM13_13300 [SAR324 cluster bacterium]|nr:hypothetical protein [SAR324 cluster bacterium]
MNFIKTILLVAFCLYSFHVFAGQCEGNWSNGQGTAYGENGSIVYEGQWKNEVMHGQGTAYWESGSKLYEGQWKNGSSHGKGTEYDEEGSKVYQGQWQNDDVRFSDLQDYPALVANLIFFTPAHLSILFAEEMNIEDQDLLFGLSMPSGLLQR